ncbi:MAG: (2Fe-2S)-binding protein [Anaerolineae bacterium]|nr:(2Fe-2S)-binding protein [Anaerolineae bacterium]
MALLSMTVNGKPVSLEVEPDEFLADVLRDRLGLIGTKIGCREGECGACTVLVDGDAILSCIHPALKAEGRSVLTIEGLTREGKLDVVQQAFVDAAAAQCGYCTPGFVMVVKALLDRNPHPTVAEIEEALAGNLCRCTGYYQIKEAVQLAVERLAAGGGP